MLPNDAITGIASCKDQPWKHANLYPTIEIPSSSKQHKAHRLILLLFTRSELALCPSQHTAPSVIPHLEMKKTSCVCSRLKIWIELIIFKPEPLPHWMDDYLLYMIDGRKSKFGSLTINRYVRCKFWTSISGERVKSHAASSMPLGMDKDDN